MSESQRDFPARLVYAPVIGFLEQTASKSPAPGGGSAAALAGALGCALVTMVINLTLGKKGYEQFNEAFAGYREVIENLRSQLTAKIDEDTAAFNRFRLANKLPDLSAEEKLKKSTEIAAASAEAIFIPASTMRLCLEGLRLSPEVALHGNVNTVSDVGSGAELLLGGLESAAYNVLINLAGRNDSEAIDLRNEVDETRKLGRSMLDSIRQTVNGRLRG